MSRDNLNEVNPFEEESPVTTRIASRSAALNDALFTSITPNVSPAVPEIVTARDIYTGSYSSYLSENSDSVVLDPFLATYTPSPQDQTPLTPTSGRTRLPYTELDLNSENYRWEEVILRIGKLSSVQLEKDGWMISRGIYMFDITATSSESLSTIVNRLLSNEKLKCTGDQLASANLEGPGMKPVLTRILKIQGLNSGMDTEVKKMLSWMNSVEILEYLTSFDGSIDTPSLWRLRVRVWY